MKWIFQIVSNNILISTIFWINFWLLLKILYFEEIMKKITYGQFFSSDASPTTPVSHGSPIRCVAPRNNMDSPKKSPQSPASSDKATVKVNKNFFLYHRKFIRIQYTPRIVKRSSGQLGHNFFQKFWIFCSLRKLKSLYRRSQKSHPIIDLGIFIMFS